MIQCSWRGKNMPAGSAICILAAYGPSPPYCGDSYGYREPSVACGREIGAEATQLACRWRSWSPPCWCCERYGRTANLSSSPSRHIQSNCAGAADSWAPQLNFRLTSKFSQVATTIGSWSRRRKSDCRWANSTVLSRIRCAISSIASPADHWDELFFEPCGMLLGCVCKCGWVSGTTNYSGNAA